MIGYKLWPHLFRRRFRTLCSALRRRCPPGRRPRPASTRTRKSPRSSCCRVRRFRTAEIATDRPPQKCAIGKKVLRSKMTESNTDGNDREIGYHDLETGRVITAVSVVRTTAGRTQPIGCSSETLRAPNDCFSTAAVSNTKRTRREHWRRFDRPKL